MSFKHIVDTLLTEPCVQPSHSVTMEQYEEWRKQYIWHALLDQRYGQSFCEWFKLMDLRIYFERDWERCDAIIRKEWLARS